MPNWCSNRLTVTGSPEQTSRMVREVRTSDSDLDFEMVLPTPRHLMEGQGWYDWRISNWGTKWEVEARLEEVSETEVVYRFESAWSPPCSLIKTLASNFPGLSFSLEYDEPGGCFIGEFRVEGGRVTLDECREMSPEEYEEIYGD